LGIAEKKVRKAQDDIHTKTRVFHRLQMKVPAVEKEVEKITSKLITAQEALTKSTAKLQDAIKLQKELVEKHAKEDQERVEEIERMNEDPILRQLRPAYESYIPQDPPASGNPLSPRLPSSPPAMPTDPKELDLNADYVEFELDMEEINFRI
jgi:hypothetical protein